MSTPWTISGPQTSVGWPFDHLWIHIGIHGKNSKRSVYLPLDHSLVIHKIKGTISDPKIQTSLFSEPADFFAYSGRNSL